MNNQMNTITSILFIKASFHADRNKAPFHTFTRWWYLAVQMSWVFFDKLLRYGMVRKNGIMTF